MRIAITGASGFVGRHLVRALREHDPLCFYRRTRGPDEGARWIRADLLVDDIEQHLAGVDVLYSVAGHFAFDDDPALQVNADGVERVVRSAQRASVTRIVHVSTVAALDSSPYGMSKRRGELAIEGSGIPYVILRAATLFGEEHLGNVHELAKAIRRRRFVMIGNGRNKTSLYYIGDFMDVLKWAAHAGSGRTLVAAAEAPMTLRDLCKEVSRAVDAPQPLSVPRALGVAAGFGSDLLSAVIRRPLPLSARRVRVLTTDYPFNGDELREAGFHATREGLSSGLHKTIAWYREAGHI